jgi:hypothetical protein
VCEREQEKFKVIERDRARRVRERKKERGREKIEERVNEIER